MVDGRALHACFFHAKGQQGERAAPRWGMPAREWPRYCRECCSASCQKQVSVSRKARSRTWSMHALPLRQQRCARHAVAGFLRASQPKACDLKGILRWAGWHPLEAES